MLSLSYSPETHSFAKGSAAKKKTNAMMHQLEVFFLNFCPETAIVEKLYYVCLSTHESLVKVNENSCKIGDNRLFHY